MCGRPKGRIVIHARIDYDRIQDPAGLIPDDEPVFLLRGQDPAAAEVVRFYAEHAADLGADADMIRAVEAWADRMDDYAEAVGHGAPDVPRGKLR
jgi:hypothetical protein